MLPKVLQHLIAAEKKMRNLVAFTATRMNQVQLARSIHLAPEPLNVHLNQIGKRIIILVPHML